jgi:phage gp46-like protein
MTDVMLYQGTDGGDVDVTSGILALDTTPFTAVYLSLFGSNVEDDGTPARKAQQWWGNLVEQDTERHYRSRTQAVLTGLPAITANLKLVEDAVLADLAWLKREYAKTVEAAASLPARQRIRIVVRIVGRDGTEQTFDLTKPWGKPS